MPQITKILKGLNGRIIFLIACAFVIIGILILRLWQLQLSDADTYLQRLRGQSLRFVRVPAVRGRIHSSDGKILVDNQVSYDLVFFLQEFKLGIAGKSKRTSKYICLLYTSPSPRDGLLSRMPSSA